MTKFLGENPLKRWKPLGGVWKSSLKFFNKDGKYVETFGNEKEKKGVYLEGVVMFVRANKMRPVLLSSPFLFSLFFFNFYLVFICQHGAFSCTIGSDVPKT